MSPEERVSYALVEMRVQDEGQHQNGRLDLSELGLTSLPALLGDLSDLQTLDLSHNKLTHLADWIGNFNGLKTLRLSDNHLTSLPESLGNSAAYKRLSFQPISSLTFR
jgi:Leucine-rich repeat (LRR) protein